MSRLKLKSIAVLKEARYLSTAPDFRGFKREYYRIVSLTTKGQMMLKVLFHDAQRAANVAARIIEKGWIDSKHWEN